jgi:hypothetical protein
MDIIITQLQLSKIHTYKSYSMKYNYHNSLIHFHTCAYPLSCLVPRSITYYSSHDMKRLPTYQTLHNLPNNKVVPHYFNFPPNSL